ncbi:hypothetical protein BJ875DRAFT_467117 [Amylocarpus encephaloides]|uniref:Uncharacterized protein n=1 Tax=Amylocarpus encephaloides TaxID=45428 RepID=A0A9P8C4S6_9HELO|nr:hypothetical protein BJ875DRAFT_467117 [Amylocarpus encephaloides]
MNRHRYEAVPQRSNSIPHSQSTPYDPVILSPIPLSTPSHNYNFNTGLPTSIPSSIISTTPSIPNSPPPSFHTHSSPGTPRPPPSTRTAVSGSTGSGVAGPYGELWGVADSTIGGHNSTSNDALATIASLKQRVEWLEESIGRLLIEKEERSASSPGGGDDHGPSRDNCCVSFTDATPDLERAVMRSKHNCCVSFGQKSERTRKEKARARMAMACVVGLICMVVFLIVAMAGRGTVSGRGGYTVAKSD